MVWVPLLTPHTFFEMGTLCCCLHCMWSTWKARGRWWVRRTDSSLVLPGAPPYRTTRALTGEFVFDRDMSAQNLDDRHHLHHRTCYCSSQIEGWICTQHPCCKNANDSAQRFCPTILPKETTHHLHCGAYYYGVLWRGNRFLAAMDAFRLPQQILRMQHREGGVNSI